eukprot:1710284-Amphidinium_carterae.1
MVLIQGVDQTSSSGLTVLKPSGKNATNMLSKTLALSFSAFWNECVFNVNVHLMTNSAIVALNHQAGFACPYTDQVQA